MDERLRALLTGLGLNNYPDLDSSQEVIEDIVTVEEVEVEDKCVTDSSTEVDFEKSVLEESDIEIEEISDVAELVEEYTDLGSVDITINDCDDVNIKSSVIEDSISEIEESSTSIESFTCDPILEIEPTIDVVEVETSTDDLNISLEECPIDEPITELEVDCKEELVDKLLSYNINIDGRKQASSGLFNFSYNSDDSLDISDDLDFEDDLDSETKSNDKVKKKSTILNLFRRK